VRGRCAAPPPCRWRPARPRRSRGRAPGRARSGCGCRRCSPPWRSRPESGLVTAFGRVVSGARCWRAGRARGR
jgi:hypothetical protein